MAWHVIELPSAVAMHQIRSVLSRSAFFPDTPDGFVLRFHPKKTYLDPLGVSLLAAWASYWTNRGVPLRCENLTSPGLIYAERMGLFEHLQIAFPKPVTDHEGAGRFVELTHIATQDALSKLCTDVGAVLRVPHLIEFVQYVLVEMVRNTLEHARADAFVCAQYYEKDKRVTIGVADCGIGIKRSLEPSHGFSDDSSAIFAAMRPGVSGTVRVAYSAPDNAGLGLFYVRGVAKASARSFVLLSGQAAYKQHADRGSAIPLPNPEYEAHDMLTSFPKWQGTVVGINIRGFDANLKSFMARVLPILNVGPKMTRTPKIRFT